jgi:hypothetical protein
LKSEISLTFISETGIHTDFSIETRVFPCVSSSKNRFLGRRIASEPEITEFHDVQPTDFASKEEAHSGLPSDWHPVYSEAPSEERRNRFNTITECRHLFELIRFSFTLFLGALLSSGGDRHPCGPGVFFGIAPIPVRTICAVLFMETYGTCSGLAARATL